MISVGRVILDGAVFRRKYLYISEKSVFTCKFTLLRYMKSPVVELPHTFASLAFQYPFISF